MIIAFALALQAATPAPIQAPLEQAEALARARQCVLLARAPEEQQPAIIQTIIHQFNLTTPELRVQFVRECQMFLFGVEAGRDAVRAELRSQAATN